MTERERKERDHKKQLLRLAKEHEEARELERVQRYHMPSDLGKGSTADYIEVDELEKVPQSEQKKWEKEQMASAVFSFGARDKSGAKDEYELLIEDQIEFIQALQMPGTSFLYFIFEEETKNWCEDHLSNHFKLFLGTKDKIKKEPELTEVQRKRLDIEETKKSLPVFPFRDDLIQAVKEHQVLIIEGETGSGKTTQIPQYLHEAGFTDGGKKKDSTNISNEVL